MKELAVYLKKNIRVYDELHIGQYQNDNFVESVTFFGNVINIPNKSFFNCSKIIRIDLKGVNIIGDFAFGVCRELSFLHIPNTVTSIGQHAFTFCCNLREVTIPKNVNKIDTSAFLNCSGLKNVTIENGCKIIGDNAFKNCTSLESITIPPSVEKIGDSAFQMCCSLQTLTILSDNLDLGANAFSYCSKLEFVHLQGVRILKTGVFSQCNKLTSLIIPTDVIRIESSAFYNCSKLVYLDFEMYSLKKSFINDSNLREIINILGTRLNIDNLSTNYMFTEFLKPEPIHVSNYCSTIEVFYDTEREILCMD
jgi:hypothetical protein